MEFDKQKALWAAIGAVVTAVGIYSGVLDINLILGLFSAGTAGQ